MHPIAVKHTTRVVHKVWRMMCLIPRVEQERAWRRDPCWRGPCAGMGRDKPRCSAKLPEFSTTRDSHHVGPTAGDELRGVEQAASCAAPQPPRRRPAPLSAPRQLHRIVSECRGPAGIVPLQQSGGITDYGAARRKPTKCGWTERPPDRHGWRLPEIPVRRRGQKTGSRKGGLSCLNPGASFYGDVETGVWLGLVAGVVEVVEGCAACLQSVRPAAVVQT